MDLQDEMTPVLDAIGRALIAATPEHWRVATLTLEVRQESNEVQGLSHMIVSPEGHKDLVIPTDELMAATRSLVTLCGGHQRPFQALKFVIGQNAADVWRFTSEWFYPH